MALIGTISGSNGTSRTAISGSLIIADEPGSRFPSLAGGVKLFVSGAKTQLGGDTPVAVFGGDTFVSGALGTDSYFQMKPVNTLRIPTNTTASYIYTSGSTNDLYFTQYNGPYANTTRLRWLESALGTGLLNGGTLSTANGTTTFSVVSGSGIIVTQNASLNSEPFPTINQVRWSNVVSQSLTYVASDQITYISVDSAGSITQSPNPPTIAQKESNIYLGRILHQTGSITNGSVTEPAISYGLGESTFNFQRAFGPLKISGHVLAVSQSSGLGTLGLIKTAGDSYVEGRNYTLNPNSPNLVLAANDPALTDCKIFREYTNASDEPVIDSGVANAGYTVIDPTKYNNAGTLSSVSPSQWTNQRVFWFPRSVNRALFVYYGPAVYGSYDDAIAGISSETFTEGANTVGSAVFVGVVTVKANETTLDSADSKITQAALHRGAGFGGGGGGSTAPGGSDTYVQFNDGGGFGGDSGLTYNKTTDSLTVAGDIAVNGGDITSTAAGLNISAGASGLSFQLAGSSFATFASGASGPIQQATLQASPGKSLVLAAGLGSTAPTPQVTISGSYVDIRSGRSGSPSGVDFSTDVGGLAQSYLNIVSGTYSAGGSTVLNTAKIGPSDLPVPHDVLLGSSANRSLYLSGSTINANAGSLGVFIQRDGASFGSFQGVSAKSFTIGAADGITEVNLVSSGNITFKLDADNNNPGHKFIVQDWNNIPQFTVGEDGSAELSGSLVVTGSHTVTGSTNIGVVCERIATSVGATGTVTFDTAGQSIFYVNNPAANFVANFTGVSVINDRITTVTVILSQSATARSITDLQIQGAAQTVNWANGVTPTVNNGKQDVYGFSLIRSGSNWKVLGQLSTYG